MINWGDIPAGTTIPFPFAAFGTNGESLTMSGIATGDIEVYKGTSMTQRNSDNGYALLDTDGIDIDSRTGIHGFSIDTSDNTDTGFYSVGDLFWVVVDAVTINSQTVRFVAGTFRLVPATSSAGVPKVDVSHWLGTAAQGASGRPQVDVELWLGSAPNALASGRVDASVGAMAAGVVTATAIATDAIDADALAADAIAEINATVDTALADYDGPTHAELVSEINAVQADIAAVAGEVSAILVDTGTDGVIVADMKASALVDFFTQDSGKTFADAVSGSVVKEIVDNAGGGSAPTAEEIADEVETRTLLANVIEISGDATAADNFETMLDGTGGKDLSLASLAITAGATISNASGSALTLSSSGGNGHGLRAEGNGSGEGVSSVGGATGHGIQAIGGGSGGSALTLTGIVSSALQIVGGTNSSGVITSGNGSGHGIVSVGGATGDGMRVQGGATSGHGLNALAPGTGSEIDADITGNLAGTINGLTATALADFFDTDSGKVAADAVAGSVVAEIGALAGSGGLTVQDIVDGVWDEPQSGHTDSGTFGEFLDAKVSEAGGGSAPTVEEIADEVQTRTIAAVTTVNGLASNSVTAAALAADAVTEIQSGLATQASVNTIDDFLDTEVAAILAAVDTEVAAILADTDELQKDWANGGRLDNILDARASQASVDTIDANVDAVLVDTGTDIPASIAAVDANVDAILDDTGTSGVVVNAAGLTTDAVTEIVNAIFAQVIEGTLTMMQAQRLIVAASAGKLSGAGTTNIKIRDTTDSLDRIDATVTADGNRTAITLNVV